MLHWAHMDDLIVTLNTVAPVFLITLLGVFLKRIGLISDRFVKESSRLVFSVAVPVTIVLRLWRTDLGTAFNPNQILYVVIAAILSLVLAWLFSLPLIHETKDKGVFVHGSGRSNYVIFGWAIISNLFGESGLGTAAVVLAFVVPLYNLLAVVILTLSARGEARLNVKSTLTDILRNPIVLAVIFATPFALVDIPLPPILQKTGNYLSALSLPLALLGIGGSLDFASMREASKIAFAATVIKLVVIPAVFTYGAILFGFSGVELGVIYVLFAGPAAITGFVMAEAMGANSRLAGNIILMTNLGVGLTMSLGIYICKSAGLF